MEERCTTDRYLFQISAAIGTALVKKKIVNSHVIRTKNGKIKLNNSFPLIKGRVLGERSYHNQIICYMHILLNNIINK